MAKATPIKPNPAIIQKQAPDLQSKESQQAKTQQNKKMSSSDAARLAAQAGFVRVKKKGARKAGIDIGDSMDAPIPLPGDDVDPDAWSQEHLENAQANLTLANAQFSEAAKGAEIGESIGATIVGSSFMPTEEDLAEMEDLAHRKPPAPVPMLEEVTTNVGKLFGIELTEEVPVGHKVLAAGLVVAGEPESVDVGEGGLKEDKLAGGLKKVTERGNQAVGEAQRMNKGIGVELNRQRTFVFKR